MLKLPDILSARGGLPAIGAALILVLTAALPFGVHGQEREVVFNQLAVSSDEASVELEFDDGTRLSAALRDGLILIDGEPVGEYSDGGPLERSFRALLGQAVSADNGELARLLAEWNPPEELTGVERSAAERIATGFDRILGADSSAGGAAPSTGLSLSLQDEDAVRRLVIQPEYLRALTAAAIERNLDSDHVALGRDFRIPLDDTLEGSLLALDSQVDIEGTLDGDLLLLGGRLRIGPEGRVTGDLRWSDSELDGNLSAVQGDTREIDPVVGLSGSDLRERIRDEVREATSDLRSTSRQPRVSPSPFGGFLDGVGGLFRTVITFGIFLAIGLAVLHFFPRQLEVVSRTALNTPGRSFLVGLAGMVLSLPLWVTGMLILTVSIIGIPVLLLWIPAVPLALTGLTILGFVAASRNVGRWVSGRNIQGLDGLDTSKPAAQIAVGLVALLGAFAVANVLEIGGLIFAPFAIFMHVAGYLLAVTAGLVGLGAVLLSQAGRDPGYAGPDWEPDFDPDPWTPGPSPSPDRPPRAERPDTADPTPPPTEGSATGGNGGGDPDPHDMKTGP